VLFFGLTTRESWPRRFNGCAYENDFAAPYRIPGNPAEAAITPHADSLLARLEDQLADFIRKRHANRKAIAGASRPAMAGCAPGKAPATSNTFCNGRRNPRPH
jgi:hypothetical protein